MFWSFSGQTAAASVQRRPLLCSDTLCSCRVPTEELDLEDGQWEDVHVITGALKLFFRELPEPLFPFSHFNRFITAISEQTVSNPAASLRSRCVSHLLAKALYIPSGSFKLLSILQLIKFI